MNDTSPDGPSEVYPKSIACGAIHTSKTLAVPSCPILSLEIIDSPLPRPKRLRRRYYASAEPLMVHTSFPQQSKSQESSPNNDIRLMTASKTPNSSSLSRKSTSSIRSFFRRAQHRHDTASTFKGLGSGQQSQESQDIPRSNSAILSCSSECVPQADMACSYGNSASRKKVSHFHSLRDRIKFAALPRPQPLSKKLIRPPSVGHTLQHRDTSAFVIPANVGAGSESRRLSTNLPDEFIVDSCELSREFCSGSRIPGKCGKEIGKGATATVRIFFRKGGSKGVQYAVKQFRKCGRHEDKREYGQKIKSEFSIANSLHHPNIVKTIRLCKSHGRWYHVMEYCDHGELYSLIQRGYLEEEDNLCFFKQLLRGVAFLHQHGIAHRDIKPENLLVTSEGHLKITDFGVSEVFSGIHPGLRAAGGQCGKSMDENRKCSSGVCGSLPYISPEVLTENGDYDPRSLDVWSCAIVCITLFFHGIPWQAAKPEDPGYSKFLAGWHKFLLRNPRGKVTKTEYPSCGEAFEALPSSRLRRIILKMLHPDPDMRITIDEVLRHQWIKNIECCSPETSHVANPNAPMDSSDSVSTQDARKKVAKIHHHLPPPRT
ncbi:kinase-like domain-containing protein [Talaromyces proteolyticus]|uniref:Kinase-like domain-containing protein n=1 Tax=Talaromyces proteolyticus TaxID=1131652 RepID=A0AAD4KWX6_9EURO|nr:kinase-like domain-containing protein [Talaromyces proteolyticus]KAH8701815.1 kinase-like domain-containing protein [Talaromyces proteolyticus]